MESAANTNFSCSNSSGLLRYRSAHTSFTGGEKMFCSGEVNSVHVMPENGGDGDCKKGRFTAVNSELPPQYPRQMDYRVGCSGGSDQPGQGRFGSSILRQNSSPAGFFSHLNSQNGYSGVRSIGSYRRADGGDVSPSSRFKSPMDFSSGLASSLGMLSRISEVEAENAGPMDLDEGKAGNCIGDSLFFSPELPFSPWNDSSYFAENFNSGIKRELDHDSKLVGATEKYEPVNRPNILSHHLSLPKTSNEIAAMEKLMHFQETVPCKVRAKRGCATHPRSIAERVRRTRISERMRKLQELVPNMDKQTNTADMLDLAVEYIKTLQKQYDTLSDKRAKCECSAFQKVISD